MAPRIEPAIPKAVPGNTDSIAAQYARAKALKDAEDARIANGGKGARTSLDHNGRMKSPVVRLGEWKAGRFGREWTWAWMFFAWLL